jgi:hypothetical protein
MLAKNFHTTNRLICGSSVLFPRFLALALFLLLTLIKPASADLVFSAAAMGNSFECFFVANCAYDVGGPGVSEASGEGHTAHTIFSSAASLSSGSVSAMASAPSGYGSGAVADSGMSDQFLFSVPAGVDATATFKFAPSASASGSGLYEAYFIVGEAFVTNCVYQGGGSPPAPPSRGCAIETYTTSLSNGEILTIQAFVDACAGGGPNGQGCNTGPGSATVDPQITLTTTGAGVSYIDASGVFDTVPEPSSFPLLLLGSGLAGLGLVRKRLNRNKTRVSL